MSIRPTQQSRRVKKRLIARLNRNLDKVLLHYAAAASAAGVSVMALTQPSEGRIVYTPAHQILPRSSILNLDVDNDGIADYNLVNHAYTFSSGKVLSYADLIVLGGSNSNQVVGNGLAYALPKGARVGSSDPIVSNFPPLMEGCERTTLGTNVDGSWPNAKNKYLGLKFFVNGETHFGWARLSVRRTQCNITAVLTGYAYETLPNKSIQAGRTIGQDGDLIDQRNKPLSGSLGALAQGSVLIPWSKH